MHYLTTLVPCSRAIRLAAYTPNLLGNTDEKASFRFFKAFAIAMDMVSQEEIPTNYEADSSRWENELSPTERCWEVMRWVWGKCLLLVLVLF